MLWAVDRSAHIEETSKEDKFPIDTQVNLLHASLTVRGTEMVGSQVTQEAVDTTIMRNKAVEAEFTLPTKEAGSMAREDPAMPTVREIA